MGDFYPAQTIPLRLTANVILTTIVTLIFTTGFAAAAPSGADSMTGNEIRQAFLSGTSAISIARQASKKISETDADYNTVLQHGGSKVEVQASKLDELGDAQRLALPLAAMPILVKDNIETIEWPTTAGSLALADNLTGKDAALITQMRDAGAIILGKTNLSEWANFRSENSISGWSGVGGQTRNAHDASRSPCGSSSGSAAAVALGYVPVAIGSETDGSIICPAAVNGVVGFKPTHGLVSGHGIVPLAASQDTAGPIAISVDDAVATLAAMIDPTVAEAENVVSALRQPGLADLTGIRVGIIADTQGFDQRRDTLLDAAIGTLETLGAKTTAGLKFETYAGFGQDEYEVLLYEFQQQLNEYLKTLPGEAGSLTLNKLITYNETSDTELSLFDQSIFIKAANLTLTEEDYQQRQARIQRAAREDGIDKLLAAHSLDALIGISVGPAWKIDEINGDAFHGPSLTSLPAVGGHPHITLPMGKIAHMPIGLSIIGARFDDAKIAAIARLFETSNTKK